VRLKRPGRGVKLPKAFIILTNSPREENERPSDLITSLLFPSSQLRKQQQQPATAASVPRGCKITGSSQCPGSFHRAIAKGFLVATFYQN